MTEKGILFKPDMIRAIREGRKTQTRRLAGLEKVNANPDAWELDVMLGSGVACFLPKRSNDAVDVVFCKPRYQVGDRVYILEPYAAMAIFDDRKPSELDEGTPIWYTDTPGDEPTNCGDDRGKWRSPMFMPKRFARIWGTVTDVRAQRLQDISEADAVAEGCSSLPLREGHPSRLNELTAKDQYAALWDSINPKPYQWTDNPWVFAYTIKWIAQS